MAPKRKRKDHDPSAVNASDQRDTSHSALTTAQIHTHNSYSSLDNLETHPLASRLTNAMRPPLESLVYEVLSILISLTLEDCKRICGPAVNRPQGWDNIWKILGQMRQLCGLAPADVVKTACAPEIEADRESLSLQLRFLDQTFALVGCEKGLEGEEGGARELYKSCVEAQKMLGTERIQAGDTDEEPVSESETAKYQGTVRQKMDGVDQDHVSDSTSPLFDQAMEDFIEQEAFSPRQDSGYNEDRGPDQDNTHVDRGKHLQPRGTEEDIQNKNTDSQETEELPPEFDNNTAYTQDDAIAAFARETHRQLSQRTTNPTTNTTTTPPNLRPPNQPPTGPSIKRTRPQPNPPSDSTIPSQPHPTTPTTNPQTEPPTTTQYHTLLSTQRARAQTRRKPSPPHHPQQQGRHPWTPPEVSALLSGLDLVHGPHWSAILDLYGANGSVSNVLEKRSQVQLKDKARNLKVLFLRQGVRVPGALEGVTGDLGRRVGGRGGLREEN